MIDEYKIFKHILCIDLKSFYASVECVLRGLDPLTAKLVVADASRGGGSVVLSVSPALKKLGIPNVCRIFEIPKKIKNIIYATPRMQTYLEYSAKVIQIYLSYISDEDLHVYSVDECFLDVTSYLKYYECTAEELATKILKDIHEKLGLYATVGIGPNMLISKLALDIESKKSPTFISNWTYEDIPIKLWPIKELSKMWSIGRKTEEKLQKISIKEIGDIAKKSPDFMKQKFGVLGEELWYHTHGIDMSLIQDKQKFYKPAKSYGNSQVLFQDYYTPEIYTIIREIVDELAVRLRLSNKVCKTVHLSIMYSKNSPGGFSRQIKLDQPTSSSDILYEECRSIFFKYYEENSPIRMVRVGFSGLTERTMYQYSMFEDADKLEKEHKLSVAMDKVKIKYGKNAVTKASAEEKHSTLKARNKMIGGHRG